MAWRKTLYPSLPTWLVKPLSALTRIEAMRLVEIRARVGQPLCWVFLESKREEPGVLSQTEMDELIRALCAYSRYAHEAQMSQGFIALPGGHRAGLCGKVRYENGCILRLNTVRAVCIRIARRIEDASLPIRKHLLVGGHAARTLILGPPGSGKTTILRDAALYLSQICGLHVAVADEREELFSAEDFCPIDVLSGASKADAVRMLMRSMAPQVLITDEIGHMEDSRALLDAASCGIGIMASAHGKEWADIQRKPALRLLYDQGAFERYILLERAGMLRCILDAQGNVMMEE